MEATREMADRLRGALKTLAVDVPALYAQGGFAAILAGMALKILYYHLRAPRLLP